MLDHFISKTRISASEEVLAPVLKDPQRDSTHKTNHDGKWRWRKEAGVQGATGFLLNWEMAVPTVLLAYRLPQF